jgi:hypothetical protein
MHPERIGWTVVCFARLSSDSSPWRRPNSNLAGQSAGRVDEPAYSNWHEIQSTETEQAGPKSLSRAPVAKSSFYCTKAGNGSGTKIGKRCNNLDCKIFQVCSTPVGGRVDLHTPVLKCPFDPEKQRRRSSTCADCCYDGRIDTRSPLDRSPLRSDINVNPTPIHSPIVRHVPSPTMRRRQEKVRKEHSKER